jgi:STE24 endopeptidase
MINIFFIVIMLALLLDFFLGLTADILNIREANQEVPSALAGIYQPEEYQKSQEYLRINTRFSLISKSVSLLLILTLWLTGMFNYLDQFIRSWGFIPLVNGFIFIGTLAVAYIIVKLPFRIYAVFSIEQRFGFNKTSPRMFIIDQLKDIAIALPVGLILLTGVLALFQYAGNYAWLYAFGIVSLVSIMFSYIAPTWIMPLFNKFSPMPESELREAITHYTKSVKFSVSNLFITDNSKRSTKSNAFFTGFGNNKRIALFDTLINQHTVPEIVAIVGHEVGHYKKKHIIQELVTSVLIMLLVFFLLSIFINNQDLFLAFRMHQQSVYGGLLFFGLLYTPLELILGIGLKMLSRRNEYEADYFSASTVPQPESMVTSLKKLASHNLSNLMPHPFYVFLNYSHPPLLDRINAINKMKPHGINKIVIE